MIDKKDSDINTRNNEHDKYNEYNTATKGCNKKCPCRIWIQCPYYVDITEQQKRLKSKSDKTSEIIHNWYDKYFRIKYEYPDGFGNG
jgi:hypothetical protein